MDAMIQITVVFVFALVFIGITAVAVWDFIDKK